MKSNKPRRLNQPYDLRVNEDGIYELWLLKGNIYVKLPGVIDITAEQGVDIAGAGVVHVTLSVMANNISSNKE